MNFALMFALALGIDYALFIVYRFRGALLRLAAVARRRGRASTMDTAGKAVLFSGVTVLISLSAVMLVPSPAFRSMALGIMLAVVFVLAATLTLLPAVLGEARAEGRQRSRCRWVHSGEHRSPRFAALGRAALAPARSRYGVAGAARARSRSPLPVLGLKTGDAVDQGRARPATARASATTQVQQAFGPGAPGALQIVAPQRRRRARRRDRRGATRASRRSCRRSPARGGCALVQAIPTHGPVRPRRRRDDRPAARGAAGRRARRRRGRREPRPRDGARGQDAARDRRRARPRLPAAAGRAAGAADRRASACSRTCSRPAPRSASPG